MTAKDYEEFAKILGRAFSRANKIGQRELIYEHVYRPLTDHFELENPRFDRVRFSHATAVAEGKADN